MLKVEIVAVGKLSQTFLKDGCAEYEKRLRPYLQLTVTEIAEQKLFGDGEAAELRVIEAEGERILKHLSRKKGTVVSLAVEGRQETSLQLADYLKDTAMDHSDVTFVIGGSLGLPGAVKQRSDKLLSMSSMTFPHQLARLMLFEQLYRAATINAGITYHK